MNGSTAHIPTLTDARGALRAPVVLYSDLSHDASMHALIEGFIADVPDRLRAIHAAWQRSDVLQMAHLATLLKGAAMGFGYPDIAQAAGRISQLGMADAPADAIKSSLHMLASMYEAALRGLEWGSRSER